MKRNNRRTSGKKHWYNSNSANPYSKQKSWEDIIYREQSEKKRIEKPNCLLDLSPELRGPPQNRWGGHVNSNIKKCKGTFGKANKGRSLTRTEKQKWAKDNGYALVLP